MNFFICIEPTSWSVNFFVPPIGPSSAIDSRMAPAELALKLVPSVRYLDGWFEGGLRVV